MMTTHREGIAIHDGASYTLDCVMRLAGNRDVYHIRTSRLNWILDERPLDMNDENVQQRIALADVGSPIIVAYSRTQSRFVVLDGVHRLHRAREVSRDTLPCRVIAAHEFSTLDDNKEPITTDRQ